MEEEGLKLENLPIDILGEILKHLRPFHMWLNLICTNRSMKNKVDVLVKQELMRRPNLLKFLLVTDFCPSCGDGFEFDPKNQMTYGPKRWTWPCANTVKCELCGVMACRNNTLIYVLHSFWLKQRNIRVACLGCYEKYSR